MADEGMRIEGMGAVTLSCMCPDAGVPDIEN